MGTNCIGFLFLQYTRKGMAEKDVLEQFRENWKRELTGKEEKSSYAKTNDKQFNQISTQEKPRVVDENNEGDFNPLSVDFTSETTSGITYQPFNIIGRLLKDSTPKSSTTASKHIDRNISYSCNLVKRKSYEHDKQTQKRKKAGKLEDIFTDPIRREDPEERLLDRLIADIDEITEIPFFDVTIPREVAVKIFEHLDMKDLCHCAQVSKSWKSLSEDELLWCRICHSLGQETIYTTREKANWKQIVQHNIERQRQLVTNWKGRVGKLSKLEHVKGGLLCAVHSCGDVVVAGYTSGEVKLWNIQSEETCIFQPSNTSLVISDDNEEGGTQANIVHSVVTSDTMLAAAYTQGNVDIWSLDLGMSPVYTYNVEGRQLTTTEVCLNKTGNYVAVSYGSILDILYKGRTTGEFVSIEKLDMEKNVNHVQWYEDSSQSSVIFSKEFSVRLFTPPDMESSLSDSHMTEIHNLIGAPVDVVDFKVDQSVLGIALGSYGGLVDGFRVKIYDIKSGRHRATLQGHTWVVKCMNMADSPPHELITGSGDRKLRVFDLRQETPVQTLTGHSGVVQYVQMDEWKVVSGASDGFACVWDRRMATKLWEMHNRHPVQYCHFKDKTLIVGNIAMNKFPPQEEFEFATHRRYRGCISVYNFLEDLTTKDVPEICLSTYDQPEASRYNIGLAMPYDVLNF